MSGTSASTATFTLSGAVTKPLTLSDATLASNYTPVSVTVGGVTYTGASVYSVIASASFTFSTATKNGQLLDYLQLTGASGSQVVVSEGEVDPSFGGATSTDIIAYSANGTAIAPELIVPGDVNGGIGGRDIAVTNLNVASATVPSSAISSASPAPLVLSGTLTNPGTVTLAAAEALGATVQPDTFLQGTSPQTYTFTGVPMFTLLSNAGIGSDVIDSYVVAAGSDGYAVLYSGAEIAPAYRATATALVAYDDGKGAFPSVGGVSGAFRTTAPFDSKGGRYVSILDTLAVGTAGASAALAGFQVPIAQYGTAASAAISKILTALENGGTAYASVSPDGSSFATPVAGSLNVAVVSDPTGSVAAPAGYGALFLQGTLAAGATDATIGNLLLAANQDNDSLSASVGSDTLVAGGGSDTLSANAAGDVLVGETGSNLITLGAGAETVLTQSSRNLILLGAGPALVQSNAADTIIGGTGSSTVDASQSVAVGLGSGTMTFINGGAASSVLGGAGSGTFYGGAGGLYIAGTGGHSVLIGGTGAATLVGGGAGDILYSGTNGQVLLAGAGSETLAGGGAGGGNIYVGGAAADVIAAGPGSDTIVAGPGNTTIFDGTGPDVVFAGSGAATMVAGIGPDVFAFVSGQAGGSDLIAGFKTSTDQIVLGGYGAAQAATVVSGAVIAGGATSLTLPDGTHVTLAGVSAIGNVAVF